MGYGYVRHQPRTADWQGGRYIIRDVFMRTPFQGMKFLNCEYAVKDGSGETSWLPCPEGVTFADIEPFEQVAA